VALHAALGMSRARRDAVLIGLGAAALILLALGLLEGRWFGIAPYHVGLADQLLHLVIGLGSLVMGLAGTGAITVPVVTGAYRRSELGLQAASADSRPAAALSAVSAPAPEAEAGSETAREPTAEPVEALPEPLGLELDEPETALGSAETDATAAPRTPHAGPEVDPVLDADGAPRPGTTSQAGESLTLEIPEEAGDTAHVDDHEPGATPVDHEPGATPVDH
jgi:hypothetical protein